MSVDRFSLTLLFHSITTVTTAGTSGEQQSEWGFSGNRTRTDWGRMTDGGGSGENAILHGRRDETVNVRGSTWSEMGGRTVGEGGLVSEAMGMRIEGAEREREQRVRHKRYMLRRFVVLFARSHSPTGSQHHHRRSSKQNELPLSPRAWD